MFISKSKQDSLTQKMQKFGICDSDIVEKFIKSSSPGGQNVNKTSTCVYLKHLPTGIEVKCQQTRYQSVNRFLAKRLLIEKIEQKILGEKSEKQKMIEKIRRQKRKRSKRAKEKILSDKKIISEKKKLRKKIDLV